MRNSQKLILAVLLIGFTLPAYAANQGNLGTSSQGDLNIDLTIQDLFMISKLTDINFPTYTGTGDLNADESICVYTNVPSALYAVRATTTTGAADGNQFQVNGSTGSIPFEVFFNNSATTGGAVVSYDTLLNRTNANTTSSDCSVGGDSANIEVILRAADLQAAPAEAYTQTLIVTIEPQ